MKLMRVDLCRSLRMIYTNFGFTKLNLDMFFFKKN